MIIVYSKPNCPQCNATKRAFKNKGVDFREVDLTKDSESLDRLYSLGYKSAPIVEDASKSLIWAGFQPDLIEKVA